MAAAKAEVGVHTAFVCTRADNAAGGHLDPPQPCHGVQEQARGPQTAVTPRIRFSAKLRSSSRSRHHAVMMLPSRSVGSMIRRVC